MTAKARDSKGRWRSITIGFRVSPEENEEINRLVAISGLSKQEYIVRKLQDKEIVVLPNPRVYKNLKKQLEDIYERLTVLEYGEIPDAELLETVRTVSNIVYGIGQQEKNMKALERLEVEK